MLLIKHIYLKHTVLDQEAIYDRVIGVLVSNGDVDLPYVLSTELAAYPPSMTGTGNTPRYPDGNMRVQMGNTISIKTFDGGSEILRFSF